MAHFHLCWELGDGYGHVGRMRQIAQALLARGHTASISLRDVVQPHALLSGLGIACHQSPVWMHRTEGMPKEQASMAEILLAQGYLTPESLSGLFEAWRAQIAAIQPDVVVADYAPTAALAARSLGIPSAAVGIGFYMPPAGKPMPTLLDWIAIPPGRLQVTEQRLVQNCNAMLARYAAAPLQWGSQLLLGDVALLCSFHELDAYGRSEAEGNWYGSAHMEGGAAPQWPDGEGAKVFAYLRGAHPQSVRLLQALADEGCRTLCYYPDIAGGKPAPLDHPLIRYSAEPLDLSLTLADAAMCINYGGDATVSQALLAGVPMLLAPMHVEQYLRARAVERMGAGINLAALRQPLDYRGVLHQILHGPSYHAAAKSFARRYAGFEHARQGERMAQALEALLD